MWVVSPIGDGTVLRVDGGLPLGGRRKDSPWFDGARGFSYRYVTKAVGCRRQIGMAEAPSASGWRRELYQHQEVRFGGQGA